MSIRDAPQGKHVVLGTQLVLPAIQSPAVPQASRHSGHEPGGCFDLIRHVVPGRKEPGCDECPKQSVGGADPEEIELADLLSIAEWQVVPEPAGAEHCGIQYNRLTAAELLLDRRVDLEGSA